MDLNLMTFALNAFKNKITITPRHCNTLDKHYSQKSPICTSVSVENVENINSTLFKHNGNNKIF